LVWGVAAAADKVNASAVIARNPKRMLLPPCDA